MRNMVKFLGAAIALALPTGQLSAETLFGLTNAGTIVTFDSANPLVTTSTGAITGLVAGDVLAGIDVRPATSTLYSIATSGNVYSFSRNAGGYLATLLGDARPAGDLSGTRFGIDFNPVPDRLRVVTDFDQNLRINVNPGSFSTIVDGTLSGPGAEAYVGAAYTNSRAGATSTMLYTLDASGNQLALSSNPNAGTYNDIGVVTGIDFNAQNNVGFDISGRTGVAYFSNGSSLYTINLGNAQATLLGTIGAGSLVGLTAAAVPELGTWLMMILGIGMVGGTLRVRRREGRFAAA